jgi:hypothetical protein
MWRIFVRSAERQAPAFRRRFVEAEIIRGLLRPRPSADGNSAARSAGGTSTSSDPA